MWFSYSAHSVQVLQLAACFCIRTVDEGSVRTIRSVLYLLYSTILYSMCNYSHCQLSSCHLNNQYSIPVSTLYDTPDSHQAGQSQSINQSDRSGCHDATCKCQRLSSSTHPFTRVHYTVYVIHEVVVLYRKPLNPSVNVIRTFDQIYFVKLLLYLDTGYMPT